MRQNNLKLTQLGSVGFCLIYRGFVEGHSDSAGFSSKTMSYCVQKMKIQSKMWKWMRSEICFCLLKTWWKSDRKQTHHWEVKSTNSGENWSAGSWGEGSSTTCFSCWKGVPHESYGKRRMASSIWWHGETRGQTHREHEAHKHSRIC